MIARGLVVAVALATAGACAAQHGPHDATSHHDFADVEQWSAVFDDPKRDAWQKPAALVAALGLAPGMTVADVGAGTGYLSRYLSEAVGPTGTVLAVDTEPTLVAHLRTRAEKDGLANVVPVLASPANPRLPARGVDLVLFLDTYHHLDDRLTYLRNLHAAMRPGGRVAVVDWKKEKIPVGPPPDHKLPRSLVLDEMRTAGWDLAAAPDVLPYHYFLIFRARD